VRKHALYAASLRNPATRYITDSVVAAGNGKRVLDYVGGTGQRDLDRSPGTSVACRLKPNSWLRKRGRSTDFTGCV